MKFRYRQVGAARSGRIWAVLAALALISATSPAAMADGPKEGLTVESYALPPGTPLPTLETLRQGAGLRKLERSTQVPDSGIPREFVGPATHGRAISSTPSALSAEARGEATPRAATYPQPSRTMTRAECEAGLQGGKVFYLKSRFAMCAGMQFAQTWAKNGTPVGESSFTLWVISTVPNPKDRAVHYQYLFTDFVKIGSAQTSGLKIKTDVDLTSWPAQAARKQTGQVPPTATFDTLRASPQFTQTLLYEPGQGRGKDDVVTMAYEPSVTFTYPPPYPGKPHTSRVGFLIAQWDAATYLFNNKGGGDPKKVGGAAFPVKVPLPYSMQAGAPERAVAQHLDDAHNKPASTKPDNTAKNVPGFTAKRPLHRLYHDDKRRNTNRSTAITACIKHWGSDYATSDPAGPRECDEYPFASTYEGAAQPQYDSSAAKNNYSARPLAKADNRAAGNILAQFLDRNRIVDGFIGDEEVDGYLIAIS